MPVTNCSVWPVGRFWIQSTRRWQGAKLHRSLFQSCLTGRGVASNGRLRAVSASAIDPIRAPNPTLLTLHSSRSASRVPFCCLALPTRLAGCCSASIAWPREGAASEAVGLTLDFLFGPHASPAGSGQGNRAALRGDCQRDDSGGPTNKCVLHRFLANVAGFARHLRRSALSLQAECRA